MRPSARRLAVRALLPGLSFSVLAAGMPTVSAGTVPTAAAEDSVAAQLAPAYRSQLLGVQLRLDFDPNRDVVRGRARLTVRLRDGQTRVLFHFNPLRSRGSRFERGLIGEVRLDGTRIPLGSLRRVRGAPGAETAFEIPRDLAPGSRHRLVVTWRAPATPSRPGWLYPMFDDTEGPRHQTETMWPTISSPEALARHRVVLRVHSSRRYVVLGSGSVRRLTTGGAQQAWRLDTERPVSSSNMFFAAVPRDEVRTCRVRVRGVQVRFVSDRSARAVRAAVRTTRRAIRDLTTDLGPFPMPRMAVLLTGWGSGMEYYGASRTGRGALRHELGHMYFGTTAVNRTWRDTWFDESAVVWWEQQARSRPVPDGFRSALAVGRPVAAPGFDLRAYGAGARVLARVAVALGGDADMLAFLADLHQRRAYRPFTTDDLLDDIVSAQTEVDRATLERWLQGGP